MNATPLTIAIGCFAAGSLVAVGIAQATSVPTAIPDSSTGVITSCVKKKGGQVRFVNAQNGKKCKKSERKVTFSQTGPQGQQGQQGTQGERGPSSAFVKASSATKTITEPSILPGPPVDNRIVTLDLEPGTYVVNAHTYARPTDAQTVSISCSLTGPTGTVTDSNQNASVSQGAYENSPFSVTGAYNNAAAGAVSLICAPRDAGLGTFNGDGEALGGTITATKVADLTVQ